MGTVKYILRLLLLALIACCSVHGVERLTIDVHRDPRFLPYEITEIDNFNFTDRPATYNLATAVRMATSDTGSGLFSLTLNVTPGADEFTQLAVNSFPNKSIVRDGPVKLTVRHHSSFMYPGDSIPTIVGGGTRHDSAFVFLAKGDSAIQYQFLASGTDISGDGEWNSEVLICLVADYDFDGRLEAIIKNNPYRDNKPIRVFCVSLDDLTIKWQFDYFLHVSSRNTLASTDSTHPAIIMTGVGSGHGLADSLTNDQFGYLTIVDRNGVVTANPVTSYFGNCWAMVQGFTPGTVILGHCLPFLDYKRLPDSVILEPALSIVGLDGVPRKTVPMANQARYVTLGDYDGDGVEEVIAVTAGYGLRIYDTSLTLIAEDPQCGIQYMSGVLPSLDGNGRTYVFNTHSGRLFTNERLEPLAYSLDDRPQFVFPLQVGSDGLLKTTLNSGTRTASITTIRRRSFVDFVSVAYVKYQDYIIAGLSSLFIGLVVTNFYRGRVSRQKRALEAANKELAETHRALQDAQAQLVAQEKYRQAQDIAGGFAHEIRNALLPAEIAIDRSQAIGVRQPAEPNRLATYLSSAEQAVSRAIGITELISQYTRLESRYMPERVKIHDVISKVVEANRLRLEEQRVAFGCTGPTNVTVTGNAGQYEILFTNLLLNALDALEGRNSPTITVTYALDSDNLTVGFADNGAGIAPEHVGRIFETFFSTKPSKGTGLGLATSKKIIELYGGSIAVRSAPGIETRFTLTFSTLWHGPNEHTSDAGGV